MNIIDLDEVKLARRIAQEGMDAAVMEDRLRQLLTDAMSYGLAITRIEIEWDEGNPGQYTYEFGGYHRETLFPEE